MQRASLTHVPFNPVLIALPVAAILGIGAALGLFVLMGAIPTSATPTASPAAKIAVEIEPTPAPIFIDTPIRALNCQVTNPETTDVLIRSAPADEFAPLGMLSNGMGVQALGRTTTEPVWFAVGYAERRGWVAQTVGTLTGDCETLPVVRNPLVPDAPLDADAHVIAIDRDGTGTFYEMLSAPGGDPEDLVWVRVINLYTEPPNNFREFTLTLECAGTGTEAVRWGMVGTPALGCGQSMTLPFIFGSSDRPLTVQFPVGSPQAYVNYGLRVEGKIG